jgi:hypothetical protein
MKHPDTQVHSCLQVPAGTCTAMAPMTAPLSMPVLCQLKNSIASCAVPITEQHSIAPSKAQACSTAFETERL